MIQLIVFDAVGTLLHPAEPISTTYRNIFHEFGIQAEEQVLKRQFRTSFVKHFEPIKVLDDDRLIDLVRYVRDNPQSRLDQRHLSSEQWDLVETVKQVASPTNETLQKECWEKVVFDCIDCFSIETSSPHRAAVFAALWQHFARPQAWRVDSQLAVWTKTCLVRKIPWVVASNFDSRLAGVLAGHSEFDTCEKVYDSASLGYQKPDQRFYEAITTDFQLPPDRILMVGDNAIGDFLAPKLHGWQASWLEKQGMLSLERLIL